MSPLLLTPWSSLGGALIGMHLAACGEDELSLWTLRRLVSRGIDALSEPDPPEELACLDAAADPGTLRPYLPALALAPLGAALPVWNLARPLAGDARLVEVAAREFFSVPCAGPSALLVLLAARIERYNSTLAHDLLRMTSALALPDRDCAAWISDLRLHVEPEDWPLTAILAALRGLDDCEVAIAQARLLASPRAPAHASAELAGALVGGRLGRGVMRVYEPALRAGVFAEIGRLAQRLHTGLHTPGDHAGHGAAAGAR